MLGAPALANLLRLASAVVVVYAAAFLLAIAPTSVNRGPMPAQAPSTLSEPGADAAQTAGVSTASGPDRPALDPSLIQASAPDLAPLAPNGLELGLFDLLN